MSGWNIVIRGGLCAYGALLFLKMIANTLEREANWLDEYERKEKSSYEKRMELLADVSSVEVVRSVGRV